MNNVLDDISVCHHQVCGYLSPMCSVTFHFHVLCSACRHMLQVRCFCVGRLTAPVCQLVGMCSTAVSTNASIHRCISPAASQPYCDKHNTSMSTVVGVDVVSQQRLRQVHCTRHCAMVMWGGLQVHYVPPNLWAELLQCKWHVLLHCRQVSVQGIWHTQAEALPFRLRTGPVEATPTAPNHCITTMTCPDSH